MKKLLGYISSITLLSTTLLTPTLINNKTINFNIQKQNNNLKSTNVIKQKTDDKYDPRKDPVIMAQVDQKEKELDKIWNEKFKNKLNSAQTYEVIREIFSQQINKAFLVENDISKDGRTQKQNMAISLTSEIFAKLRPTANQFLKGNDQDNKEIEFVVVISHLKNKDDKELAISINKKFEFGNVETAWKGVAFKGTDGNKYTTDKDTKDMSHFEDDNFEVYEIGYYDDGEEIRAIRLPKKTTVVPMVLPREITSTEAMFKDCIKFGHPNIGSWNTSNLRNVKEMFKGAKVFKADISDWNVKNIVNMQSMLEGASEFDKSLQRWNLNSISSETDTQNLAIKNWNLGTKIENNPKAWPISLQPFEELNPSELKKHANNLWLLIKNDISQLDTAQTLANRLQERFRGESKFRKVEVSPKNINTKILPNSKIEFIITDRNTLTSVELDIEKILIQTESIYIDPITKIEVKTSETNLEVVNQRIKNKVTEEIRSAQEDEFINLVNEAMQNKPVTLLENTKNKIRRENKDRWEKELQSAILQQIPDGGITEVKQIGYKETQFVDPTFSPTTITVIRANKMPKTIKKITPTLPQEITSLEEMFAEATNFNDESIKQWNTSNIKIFKSMFKNAHKFNQDISQWDTRGLISTEYMFLEAHQFNQNISQWDMSKVTNIGHMFNKAYQFNQDLEKWNTQSLVKMDGLFRTATSFNGKIGTWDTSNVTNMAGVFDGAHEFNQDISSWNTSNVTDMSHMFKNAYKFNQNLRTKLVQNKKNGSWYVSWDVSNVKHFELTFSGAKVFNADISNWNVSKGVDFTGMFANTDEFNQNIGQWNIITPHNLDQTQGPNYVFSKMFKNAKKFNQDLSSWNLYHTVNNYKVEIDKGAISWTLPRPKNIPNHPGGEKPSINNSPRKDLQNIFNNLNINLNELYLDTSESKILEVLNYLVNPQQLNIFKLKIDIDRQNNKFTISSKDMNTYYNSVEFRLKNQNSINLDQVITVRDLGKIKDNNLTKEKIIDLINSKNQSANLDANLLNVKIDRKNNQFIISPIPHSNKYQGSVAISYEVEKPTSNTGKVVGGVVGGIATTAGIGGAAVYVGLNHLDKVKYLFKSMFRRKK